jgi:hypothetical protein
MPKILYDTEQARPACALLQAAFDCDHHLTYEFPSETWLVHPTGGMKVLAGSREDVEKLVAHTRKVHGLD